MITEKMLGSTPSKNTGLDSPYKKEHGFSTFLGAITAFLNKIIFGAQSKNFSFIKILCCQLMILIRKKVKHFFQFNEIIVIKSASSFWMRNA